METVIALLAIACFFMGLFLYVACKDLNYLSSRLYDMEYKNLRIAVRVEELTRDYEILRQEVKNHIRNPNLSWSDDVDGVDIEVTEEEP